MPGLQSLLQKRFAPHLRSWPSPVVEDVVAYLGDWPRHAVGRRDGAERFWSLLPRWLLADRRFVADGRRREFLNDILWGQYCLFLFVRIHDDLFDGQARSMSLLFVADRLLVESETAFARHVPEAAFWRLFRDSLTKTTQAILEVDHLQRQPGAMHARLLGLHAKVSAIFKVGAAAICVRSNRMREFRSVSRCADDIAIAEQILDDLLDVEEDLARGRYSFAFNDLLGEDAARVDGRAERLARRVLLSDGVGALMERARIHLVRAEAAIAPVRLPPVVAYVDTFRRHIDELRQQFHEVRAARVLKDLL
jgi:hypothetical protein